MVAIKEVEKIIQVLQSYLNEEKTKELLIKLDEEIGKKSETEIKTLLSELRNFVDKPLPPPPLWLWISFYTLVVAHILLVIAFVGSFFILPFMAPWYVAVPCMTFIWFFSTTKVECRLTDLENTMRKSLGMKKIGGFVGHYFFRPVKILTLKSRARRRRLA